MNLLKNKI